MAEFALADIPVKESKPTENEYTPLVDQLIELGLDSGKELVGVLDSEDAATVAKAKFQAAARGRGVSGVVKVRDFDENEKHPKGSVKIGMSVREKITRKRGEKSTAETTE